MDEFRKSSLPFLLTCSLIIHAIPAAIDTIDSSQTIRDGETVVSSGGMFELGFFSPGNSGNRYVGIWYKNITVTTAIWVANREVPLTSKSGVLKVIEPGILALLNDTGGVIWSSTTSRSVRNPAAQLLNSGNLVVKDANEDRPKNYLWQSFDYPSDTLLSGMALGWNFVTGVETYISSWRSNDDPSPGEFTIHLDPTGYPQIFQKKGKTVQYRIGPWNGLRWAPDTFNFDPTYRLTLRMNKNEEKYIRETVHESIISRSTINPNGVAQAWIWNYRTQAWDFYTNFPMDKCDSYNLCGAYGNCNIGNAPSCGCLERFVPKDLESWSRTDWSKGCVRRTNLSCQGDVFLKYSGIKFPDSRYSGFNDQIMHLAECEAECSRDCNCTAYTQLNISNGGSGCLFYHGDLIDIRAVRTGGQELYIRMASTELDSKGQKRVLLIASFTSVAGIVLVCLSLVLFCTQKRNKDSNMRKKGQFSESHGKEAELAFFNISTILKATDHFSINNKLGEGGFGPVYRGKLEDGQEIAVKRLSKTSSQGVEELKNEVILIAKLQHRNLVRLLGCCIQGKENMLIYEYMANNSLDLILFDQTKSMLLDWQKRFHIINGIAKGLLYLHQDSRLRIIHRDLKASNILLDADMNPKISDFGLARSFGGNETQAKTRRVVGTYGYMSPEYALDGLFSVKSDAFSFGVLVLEVVSGKKNRGFFISDQNLNLLGHAWRLYKEDNSRELVDASLGDSFNLSQVLRTIHVGLLCVQKSPEDRPSMSSVVFMLGNQVALPQAKQPCFFTGRDVSAAQSLTFLLTCSLIIHAISAATDTIDTSQTIRDGETVVSSAGRFELGFFSPGNSGNRYVGIWYKNITVRTYVWVANREVPLTSKSGVLKVMGPGILAILNDTGGIIWSSNMSRSVQNPAAQLLDSGNLVVKDANDDRPENYLWQSFDYPSDTFLSGMSLGWNFVTGVETYISSWRSNDDPAPGQFTSHLDPTGYPQIVHKRGKAVQYRIGPWNGLRWAPETSNLDPTYRLTLRMNKNEVKYMDETVDQSVISRGTLNPNGVAQQWIWNYRTQAWDIYINVPSDKCDNYNLCGAHGSCNIGNSPSCGCLDKFVPKDPESWTRTDWSNGCVRRTNLSCQGDVFLKYSGIKLPDSRYSTFNDQIMILAECEADCSRDCNCTAYTQLNISNGGSGCP